jgi:hypothetical protein
MFASAPSLVLPRVEGIRRGFVVGAGDFAMSPMGVIAHGDETRGGSGSKVNMEAILRSRG